MPSDTDLSKAEVLAYLESIREAVKYLADRCTVGDTIEEKWHFVSEYIKECYGYFSTKGVDQVDVSITIGFTDGTQKTVMYSGDYFGEIHGPQQLQEELKLSMAPQLRAAFKSEVE